MVRTGWLWLGLLCALVPAIRTQEPPGGRPADAFFVPTRPAVADAMLRLAGVTADDVVYDLGSGDGRILVLAAQKYGARGVGIEIDPALVARARLAAADGGVADRVRFVQGDLFAADLGEATVVTLYLSTTANRRLVPKLRAELGAGARVVSQQFDLGAWLPDERITVEGSEVFLWRIGGGALGRARTCEPPASKAPKRDMRAFGAT